MAENTYFSRISIRSSEQLGDAVAQSRKTKGYSQQEFADLAGVGRRFVSDLENGKATIQFGKLLQVLTALGLDLEVKSR
jgi:HTH-type transcriptional regulator/antitoxin HipB